VAGLRILMSGTMKRDRHQTQWAAQFAVASELCKRNCKVALSLGNQPGFDLMVMSPTDTFPIEVKGQATPQYWQMEKKIPHDKLFYVFAYVPDGEERNRFFVMDQKTVDRLIDEHYAAGGNSSKHRWGIQWRVIEGYENNWEILPGLKPT
jgi:hypothetical protein